MFRRLVSCSLRSGHHDADRGGGVVRQGRSTVIAGDLAMANVVPTWRADPQARLRRPLVLRSDARRPGGTQYPWKARIWKSRNGSQWTQAAELPSHVYQPPGLVVDSANRLHLQVGCYTGAECYPGVDPAPGPELGAVYTVRLASRLTWRTALSTSRASTTTRFVAESPSAITRASRSIRRGDSSTPPMPSTAGTLVQRVRFPDRPRTSIPRSR